MRGLAPLRIVSACLWASCHRWQSSHIDMSLSRLVSRSPVGGTRVTSTEPGVRHAVRSQRQTSRRALAQEAGPCAPSAQDAAHHVLRCISERGGSAHAWCRYVRTVAHTAAPAELEQQLADLGAEVLAGALSAAPVATPDVDGARERRCDLFPRPVAYKFATPATEAWLGGLFRAIAGSTNKALPRVTLDRFDLFHAHFFYSKANKLGLLFHAAEFPAHCDAFPYFLGYCQQGSTLEYTEARMDFRNYVWYDGSLVALDLGEKSPLLPALVHPGLWPLRTTYEGDFGEPLGDVYFFPPGAAPTAHTLSGQGTAATSSAARADGLVDRPHVQRLPGRAQPWAVERLQQGLAALLSRLQVGSTRGGGVAVSVKDSQDLEHGPGVANTAPAPDILLCFPRHPPTPRSG